MEIRNKSLKKKRIREFLSAMTTMVGDPGIDHQVAPLPPPPASAAPQARQQRSTTAAALNSWELTLSSLPRNSVVKDGAFLPFTFQGHIQDSAQWHSTSNPSEGNFVLRPSIESHHPYTHGPTATRNQVPQLATWFNDSLIPSSGELETPLPHNSFTALLLQETSSNSWIQSPARKDFHRQLYPQPQTFTDTRGCVSSDVGSSRFSNIMNGMAASSMPEPSTTKNQLLHIGNHGLAVGSNRMEVPILGPREEILSNTRNSWQVEVPNRHEPRKTSGINHSSGRAGIKSCTCKKSQCLMKFCVCFATGYRCGDSCACKDCKNDGKHEDEVRAARTKILSCDRHAFHPKIVYTNITNDGNHDISSMLKHWNGCNCKKSKCKSKYCECYAENVGCSAKCRCEVCENPFNLRKATEQRSDAIVSQSPNARQERPVNLTYPQVPNSSGGHSLIQKFQTSSGNGLSQPSLVMLQQPSMNYLSNEIGGFASSGLDFPTPWISAPSLSSFELLNALQFCHPHVPDSNLVNGLPEYQGAYQ